MKKRPGCDRALLNATADRCWQEIMALRAAVIRDGNVIPGAAYAAREVRTGADFISAELAGAWPPVEGLGSYRRTVSVSGGGVTLRDETDWPGEVALTLMTRERPVPEPEGLALGTLGHIRFDTGAAAAAVEPVTVTDPRLRTAWPETIYRITLRFRQQAELRLE